MFYARRPNSFIIYTTWKNYSRLKFADVRKNSIANGIFIKISKLRDLCGIYDRKMDRNFVCRTGATKIIGTSLYLFIIKSTC